MIALNHFNQLSGEQAVAVLEPCVAVSGWAATLAAGRPRWQPVGHGAAARNCWTPPSG